MIEYLLMALIISLFVPDAIYLQVGQIRLTPTFVLSMILFPVLVGAARIRWCWPDLVMIALLLCIFISTLMSSSFGRTAESFGRIVLTSAVPFLAGRFIMQDLKRLGRMLGLLTMLLAIFAVASLLESFARINIHSMIWDVRYSPHHEKRLGLTRAHGWTSHAIMFGLVNAIFLPIILVAAREKMKVVGRGQWFKFFAIGMGCFLSLSTGAWGPAFVSLIFVVWDYISPLNQKTNWPITFATLIGGYILLEFLANRPLLRILMMKMHLTSPDAWYYRWLLYDRVYDVMPGHWWWGHGLATPEAFQGFQSSIDNNFLLLLLNYGRIGLAMWIAMCLSVLLYAGKAVWATKATRYTRLTRAMCFSLIGMILTQFSVALFSTPATLYWLMMGLIIGSTLVCRAEQSMLSSIPKKRKRRVIQKPSNKIEPICERPVSGSQIRSTSH